MDINMSAYENAVKARGKNIAVSASAGCGKTTTMIKRIAGLVLNEKKDISRFLVVTFTRAAAAEMKQKLKDELIKYSGDDFAARQISGLEISDINTIDGFCAKICREFFNAADIPPDFSIMEEKDACLYKNRLINALVEEYYENNDGLFFELSQIFAGDRTDSGIISYINRLYAITVTMPDSEGFLRDTALSSCEKDLDKNNLALFLSGDLCLAAETYMKKISFLAAACAKSGLTADYEFLSRLKDGLSPFDRFKTAKDNFGLLKELNITASEKIKSLKKDGKDAETLNLHEAFKALKSEIRDEFQKIYGRMLTLFADRLDEKLDAAKKYLAKLCELTLKFRSRYMQFKKDSSLLDFNDLEYYTLQILNDEKSRETIKCRYDYIFVDEFQDTNRVQDEIISRLCSNGNTFIVGDTKQSIYRFRGAENEIFKEKTCSPGYENLTLGVNFRSGEDILRFINTVFSYVMKESFSLINYSSFELTGAKDFKLSDNRPGVIIDVLEQAEKARGDSYPGGIYSVKEHSLIEGGKSKSGAEEEGRHIADEIKKLISSKTKLVCGADEMQKRYESGKSEYIEYDDITVLVRAKKTFTEGIYNSLTEAGIPVSAEFSYSLNEYPEITLLIDYLKLIDNFMQDIPLLAALKSCIGRFSDEELADIRIKYGEGKFFEAFIKYAENEKGEAGKKAAAFYTGVKKYCGLSKILPCPRLIMQVVKETKYEEYLLSLNGGSDFAGRVDSLLNIIYREAYALNLPEFLNYLDNASGEIKLGPKPGCAQKKVRLCTIHTSKGLEYGIVFLAGCGQRFLFPENRERLLIHNRYGLATDFYDYGARIKEESFIKNSLEKILYYETVKEEINILYVAMTRAKYRLYMCGTKNVENYVPVFGLYDIKNAGCYYDFVLNAAVRDVKNRGKTQNNLYCTENLDLSYEFNIIREGASIEPAQNAAEEEETNYVLPLADYKYQKSTVMPLKNSVTRLNAYEDFDEYSASNVIYESGSIETGTAYHKILELIDFKLKKEEIKTFIDSLVDKNIFTAYQAEKTDINIISGLLGTDIIKFAANCVNYREKAFMAVLQGGEAGLNCDDEILVQGVLDLLILTDGGAIIVDYKFSGGDDAYLIKRYEKQLRLYKLAAEKILGINVKKCVILNILNAREIEIT